VVGTDSEEASNPGRRIWIQGTEKERRRMLTGGRSSPARNVQEAVDGEVSVVGDDGGVVYGVQ
jgi:hypothetical protein